MMVGYALDHDGDCSRMWEDPNTKRVQETRYITWLRRRMFFQRQLPAEDLAIEPIEYETTGSEAREGIDNSESSSVEDEDEQKDDDDGGRAVTLKAATVTRSGRAVTQPTRFIEEIGATAGREYEIGLTSSELRFYALMRDVPEGEFARGEIACVGAGLGGGFENTAELHVIKYTKKATMTEDHKEWEVAVDDENQRMVDSGAWKAVHINDVPRGAKVITSTWTMKKKSNGV